MWPQIIGAVVGGMSANKQAKAQDAATQAQMAGFNQYKPYVDANLAGSSAALDGVLNQGAYTGQTLAGPNQYQTGTANQMGNYGMDMQNSGAGMMANNSSFGQNYNDTYGQSQDLYGQNQAVFDQSQGLYGQNQGLFNQSQDVYNQGAGLAAQNQDLYKQNQGIYDQFQSLSEDAKADRLGIATNYAAKNSDALVNSAMRDDRRNLQENTLTGIDLAASGSGNTNSSRAGVAEAVANRGYDDRRADVSMGIQNSLIDRSLTNQAQQFADQSNSISNAGTASGMMANNLTGTGNALAGQNNALTSAGNQLTGASNALNSSSNYLGNSSALLSGANASNQGIQNSYNTGMNTLGEGANFGMNAGNALHGYDQASLNDQQAAFERQRDFELDQRKGYQSGILGKAPGSPTNVQPNQYDVGQGIYSGAMAGFGFDQQYGDQMFGMGTGDMRYTTGMPPSSTRR